MSTGTETAGVDKAAHEAPQPTHINAHIHQESALAKLLLAGCSMLQPPDPASGTAIQRLGNSRLLVASWVVQIVLGVLSGVLGGFLYIYQFSHIRTTGTPIWTRVVALLNALLVLAAFCTSVAAIVTGTRYFHYDCYFSDNTCQISSSSWIIKPPTTLSPEEMDRNTCACHT